MSNTRFCNFIIQCSKHGINCKACDNLPKVDYYGTKSFHHRGPHAQTMSALKKIYRDIEGHNFNIIPIKGRLGLSKVERERPMDEEEVQQGSKRLKANQSEGLRANLSEGQNEPLRKITENFNQRFASLESVQQDQAVFMKELSKKNDQNATKIEDLTNLFQRFGQQAQSHTNMMSQICGEVVKLFAKTEEAVVKAPNQHLLDQIAKPEFNVKEESDLSSADSNERNSEGSGDLQGGRFSVSNVLNQSVFSGNGVLFHPNQ